MYLLVLLTCFLVCLNDYITAIKVLDMCRLCSQNLKILFSDVPIICYKAEKNLSVQQAFQNHVFVS